MSRLSSHRSAPAAEVPTEVPSEEQYERISPLTNRQMLFWLGQVLNPDLPVYDIIFTFHITGPLEPDRFDEAFRSVVARHDALRSVVWASDGVPRQAVLPALPSPLEFLDLRDRPDPDAAYSAFLASRKTRKLDLHRQLFDAVLLRLDETRWVWYLNQHHVMTDGWTTAKWYQQVADAYAALTEGTALPHTPGLSFHDYVAREIASRDTASYKNAETYRLEKLSVPLAPYVYYAPELRQRTNEETRVSLSLGPERTAALKALAQREDMPTQRLLPSLFNLFVASLFVYLNRLNGHEIVSVGMVFHNRLTPEDQQRMGMFVNLFPLQVRIEPGDRLHTVVEKTMLEWFAALRYGPYCISNPGRQRAYDVIVNFLPMQYDAFAGMPARVVWEHSGYSDGNHSLSVHIEQFNGDDDFVLHLDFNDGVFTPADRARACRDLLAVIDAFLADTQTPLDDLNLLNEQEKKRLWGNRAVEDAGQTRPPYVPPQTPTERRLAGLWKETLGVPEVGRYDDFFLLGGHSLLAVRLVAQIEQVFGRKLPVITLFQAPTLISLARALDTRPSEQAPTLIPLQTEGTAPPLFCVPPGASSVIGFAALARHLAPDIPVYGLEPLGVGADETPHDRVEDMARFYVEEIRTVQPVGPYHLLGSCLGGWVALEMAHQLRHQGEDVGLLALLDTVDPPPLSTDAPGAIRHPRKPRRRYFRRIRFHLRKGDLIQASFRKGARWLLRRLRRFRKAPRVQRAHWIARNRYRTGVYPGTITLFVARDSEGFESKWPDRKENWDRYSTEPLRCEFIPGTHATAHKEPHVRELAEKLRSHLTKPAYH